MSSPEIERYSGVRAVQTAANIMVVLADAPGPLSLTDLSERCGLAPAKAHRYLASMVESGIARRRGSGLYDLGPEAFRIGLSALARVDTLGHFGDLLPDLADRLGVAALLSIWTSLGPTVMRFERHVHHPIDMYCPGAILSLIHTSSGQAFLYHMPERLTRPVLAAQLDTSEDKADVAAAARAPCADGLFRFSEQQPFRRFSVARAVLNQPGDVRCVIKLFGPDNDSIAIDSEAAQALLDLR